MITISLICANFKNFQYTPYGMSKTAIICNGMCSRDPVAEVEAIRGLIGGLGVVLANHN